MSHRRPEQESGCCSLVHISSSRRHFPLCVCAAAMATPQQIASFAFLTAHAANTTSQKRSAAPPICFQQTSSRVSVNPCTADRSKNRKWNSHSFFLVNSLTLYAPFQKVNMLLHKIQRINMLLFLCLFVFVF